MLTASRLTALAAALGALLLSAGPASADPTPFGHACVPQDGVRFCPATGLDQRVPSWDGTPIDVDVTLPPDGEGPFPTILLLHGLGGTKTSFETQSATPPLYSNEGLARQGYAVVTPTERGFGDSCGNPASRTAGCEAGWTRLADMRYEVRDVQTLVGKLVDEGITKPDAVGSTGISYGGGMSMMLAFLHDRIRLPDGGYAPWTSPNGTPISLTAAWPRWLWSNGESIFTRNGRGAWSRLPHGVEASAYAGGIFAVAGFGFVAPTGGDISSDVTLWKRLLDQGTYTAQAQAVVDNAYNYHGVANVAGTPAPLLMQSGWTDALFPVNQALAPYDAILKKNPSAPVALQLADLGHNPGANHPNDVKAFDTQGLAFFDSWLKGQGPKIAPGLTTAYTMSCPKNNPSGGGPFTATTYAKLARGVVRARSAATLRITSKGGDATLAGNLSPLSTGGGDLCKPHPLDKTSRATVVLRSPGITLLGQPVITGRVVAKGRLGQLDARVWDLNAKTGQALLITRGAYRLEDNQKGSFRFTLDGNGWKFAKGHRIVVELLGRDAPTYAPSPGAFSATLKKVTVAFPVRDKPSRKLGVTAR